MKSSIPLANRRKPGVNLQIALPKSRKAGLHKRNVSAPDTPTPDWVHDARQAADYLAVYEAQKHKTAVTRGDNAPRLSPFSPPNRAQSSAPSPPRSPVSFEQALAMLPLPPTPASAPATSNWPPSPRSVPEIRAYGPDGAPAAQDRTPMTRGEQTKVFLSWLLDRILTAVAQAVLHFFYAMARSV